MFFIDYSDVENLILLINKKVKGLKSNFVGLERNKIVIGINHDR